MEKSKSKLHPRNRHRERYDFDLLKIKTPELTEFVHTNDFGSVTIDFFDPKAVLKLNEALLKEYYDLEAWSIPEGYLCPPIPGRADYIHHAADIVFGIHPNTINPDFKKGKNMRCLDIGAGANCVYPLIGSKEYDWSFVASEFDQKSLASAQAIVESNERLKDRVEIREQVNAHYILNGIIRHGEYFDLSVCNPPFHSSPEDASAGSTRKIKNLKGTSVGKPKLNFGGQNNELWCEGGEVDFITKMIFESKNYKESVGWYTTLVSKENHLNGFYQSLKKVGATDVKTIGMGQGNKKSRILAWTYG
jgi:23S rRNA (adenine1618-N6)-methyltransferase